MPSFIFCCACAAARGTGPDFVDDKSEKPLRDVYLSCCGRTICARCIDSNPRFATYCPFCQKLRLERQPSSGEASASLPPPYTADDPEALEPTPSRTPPPPPQPSNAELAEPRHPPPSYTAVPPPPPQLPLAGIEPGLAYIRHPGGPTSGQQEATDAASSDEEVTHFLHPTDNLPSLSLAYGVPLPVLRSHNHLHADHLLSARRTLKVPRSHYAGTSLSPQPVEGEEESERKARLRRFMVRCKCADYKIANLYLEEHDWDLEKATDKWWADERWEKENPLPKGKTIGRSLK